MKVYCVIDMQNDFIDGALGTPEAQAIVEPVTEFIKKLVDGDGEPGSKAGMSGDWEIVATRDTHYNDYLETNEGKHLPVEHCLIDSHGWLINDKVYEALEAAGLKIPVKHIANSAAIAELPQYQLDMVRLGITLYGSRPADIKEPYRDYRPVMTLKTQVAFVKTLPAGRDIGYGRTFTTQKESRIATVPIGYADGVSRHLSNKGCMVIRGKRAPIVGRVCMDQIMLDVTDIPDVAVGDDVIVYGGPELPAEEVAATAGTISYEMFCVLHPRIPRIYVRD